jgi:hypothetical protein
VDDITAAHPCGTWEELCLFLDGMPSSFTGQLLTLIEKADPGNRARLRAEFPRQVAAWETWRAIAPCTWGELEAAIPAEARRVTVTFDVTDSGDHHALIQALDDYQAKQRDLAADGDNPDKRTGWAMAARRFRDQADEAAAG